MSEDGVRIERTLGRWDLVLLKVVAIVNINNVPPVAVYGWFSLVLWALAFVCFFIPEAIAVLVRHLIEERGHHRLTIDPAAANERAIRCYEAVGFERVGIMRQYERGDDGSWHDGLLLELLADEGGAR